MYRNAKIKIQLILLLLLIFNYLQGQKAELMIVKHQPDIETNLQVLNENFSTLYDEDLIPSGDTLILRIDYDKRFYLNLNNYTDGNNDLPLLSLYLNKVPIIIIHSDVGPGDHSWPFYSGVGKPELRIVGGNTVSIRDYPWQVFIRAGDYLCGGTIIADKWILTAAHCLYDDENEKIPDDEISFLAGVERPFEGFMDGARFDIEYSVIHEDYNPNNYENDLALLRTSEVIEDENATPINIITPEDVDAGATDPGVVATITGWGITNVEPLEFPDNLQSLEIPIVTKNVAEAIWGPLPDNMLMAGYPNDRGDACSGDSGGPLIVRVGNEFKIAGVTSWGSSQCNSVGGYVRLSEFTEWLSKNTGIGQNQFRTVRPVGSAFRCQNADGEPTIRTYTSDTLANAISYDWKIEPQDAGLLTPNGISAEVAWSSDFSGEAYISTRALTPDGFTNFAGQRVVIGMVTEIFSVSSDTSACFNSDLALNVDAVGSDLFYHWYLDDKLLLSGPQPVIFINDLQESEEGIYQVEVTGSCGTVLSEEIEVKAIPLTEIITYPEDQVVTNGLSFSLDVEVAGDNLQYKWSRDGEMIENSNKSSLEFDRVDANVTGLYSIRIDGTCGSKVSPQIYVYVDPEIQDFPDGVNIWPTLTRDFINVAIDSDEIFDIYIYNSSGIYLGRQEKRRYQTRINLGNFAPDVYIVEVRLRRESRIYRVVRVN